jgi:iron-sulfur cluster insertion protein
MNNYNISLTPAAKAQIALMKENDYTISDLHLRVTIKGKECDGFRYAVGFSAPRADDLVISFEESINVLLDPFIAQYFTSGTIDYEQTPTDEGFLIQNDQETNYHGKFFSKTVTS